VIAMLAVAAASGGIDSGQIIAFTSVAGVAVTILVAYNSFLKDRSNRRDEAREKQSEEDEVQTAHYQALKDTVDHLAVAMVGRPAKDGLPPIKGFVDEQREFNVKVESELTDVNGGGTLRGAVQALRRQVAAMQKEIPS
jgi:hypothetical protein